MILDSNDISAMTTRNRAALINSLSGYKSANLIGTTNSRGETNLAIMSSVVHLGSHPPLLALIIRPGDDERHTLSNLLETGYYTINHVSEGLISAAHQTAARYQQYESEFEATGLSEEWKNDFKAPFVTEARVKLGMRFREHQVLEINGTNLIIGEVELIEAPEDSFREDGSLDLTVADTVALSGLDSYHKPTTLKRMAYAKPDLPPRELD
ncbi:MAG: flavin oxidoreductase [Cellvibrionaceae bacterium]|nr:flavin oxidoreductase [Cellvibrionaceae bacterium]|tara:strand:- start:43716 stop:44348 length:633 start_codon:yes stop_codon:yes gene_type:complete